ncbi:unannotated protein [freshwater metagenome]|uniref:Unannotated protein n=1 Tax=freshwater metagenome TaxID=449393 RepID=A0A6J7ETK5_9ZZZZ
MFHQLARQHARVQDCLRSAVRSVGLHGVRRIAEERDPARPPRRNRFPIGHWIFEHRLAPTDEAPEVEEVEFDPLRLRKSLGRVRFSGPVLLGHRPTVARSHRHHPVDQLASVADITKWVDDHPAAEASSHHHSSPAKERVGHGYTPPHRDAVPQGGALSRNDQLTQCRVHPVAPNDHVCIDHREVVRIDAVPEVDSVVTDALPHCAEENTQQVSAMDRPLGPPVSGLDAAWFDPQLLAETVVIAQLGSPHGHTVKLSRETKLGEFARGVRQHIDPDTEFANLAGSLVEVDVPKARSME